MNKYTSEPCPKGICERLAGIKTANSLRQDNARLLEKLSRIKRFVSSDSNAATYQTLGQYRNEIIKIIDEVSKD